MGGRSARAPVRHECHHGAEGLDEHCKTIPITGRAPHQTKTPPAELTGHQVLAPRVGLEPTTTRLTAAGSTIELSRNLGCLFATRNSIGKSSSRARGNFGDFFMTLGPVLTVMLDAAVRFIRLQPNYDHTAGETHKEQLMLVSIRPYRTTVCGHPARDVRFLRGSSASPASVRCRGAVQARA